MRTQHKRRMLWVGLLCLAHGGPGVRPAQADLLDYTVSFATPLSNPAGFDAQYSNGNGTLNNNTVTLDTFNFHGGGPQGLPDPPIGDSSGALATSVTVGDRTNMFQNEFFQMFSPGSSLSYNMALNVNGAGTTPQPDLFGVQLYKADGVTPYITTDPSGNNFLYTFTFDSTSAPTLGIYSTNDPSLGAQFTPSVQAVPEPATWAMFGLGALVLAWRQRRKQLSEATRL